MGDLRAGLAARWERLLPGHDQLRDELLQRWDEPHRHYHELRHLTECLTALDLLGAGEAELLAAWFHDIVYDGVPGQDETRSAAIARARLEDADAAAPLIDEVERLVLMTIDHDPAQGDAAGARLNDADLAILGSPGERYVESVADIRREYGHLDDAQWRTGRRQVLQTFLARPQLYRTRAGRERWEERARRNIAAELERL